MCHNVLRLQAAFHRWSNSLQSIHAGVIRHISMGGRWAQGSPTRVQRTEEQRWAGVAHPAGSQQNRQQACPLWGDKVTQSERPQGPGGAWLQVTGKTLRWYPTFLGGTVPPLYVILLRVRLGGRLSLA